MLVPGTSIANATGSYIPVTWNWLLWEPWMRVFFCHRLWVVDKFRAHLMIQLLRDLGIGRKQNWVLFLPECPMGYCYYRKRLEQGLKASFNCLQSKQEEQILGLIFWWRNSWGSLQSGALHGSRAGKASSRAALSVSLWKAGIWLPSQAAWICPISCPEDPEEIFTHKSSAGWISWLGQVTWHRDDISAILA